MQAAPSRTEAEQAAQIVLDGQRIAELETSNRMMNANNGWLRDVRERLEDKVRELEAERDEALVHVAELEAGNAELRRRIVNQAAAHDLPRLQDVAALHAAEQKLADANVLLGRWKNDTSFHRHPRLHLDTESYLDGQPAAPSRTEAEQAVLDAMGKTRISEHSRVVFDCAQDEYELCRAVLALRGLK